MLRIPRGDVPEIVVVVNSDRIDERYPEAERFERTRTDPWSADAHKQAGRGNVLSKAVGVEVTLVVDSERFEVGLLRFVHVAHPGDHVEVEVVDHLAQVVKRPRRVVVIRLEIVSRLGKEVGPVRRTIGGRDERLVEAGGFDRVGDEAVAIGPMRRERPISAEGIPGTGTQDVSCQHRWTSWRNLSNSLIPVMKAQQLPLWYALGTVFLHQAVLFVVTAVDGFGVCDDDSYEIAIISIEFHCKRHIGVGPAERSEEDGIVERVESRDLPGRTVSVKPTGGPDSAYRLTTEFALENEGVISQQHIQISRLQQSRLTRPPLPSPCPEWH